jgi:hypothetical protein
LCAEDDRSDDDAYLEMLEKYQKSKASAPSEDDGIIMNDWTDDEETETALDKHDPYSLLVHSMNALQSSHPAQFQVPSVLNSLAWIIMIFLSNVDASHQELLPRNFGFCIYISPKTILVWFSVSTKLMRF